MFYIKCFLQIFCKKHFATNVRRNFLHEMSQSHEMSDSSYKQKRLRVQFVGGANTCHLSGPRLRSKTLCRVATALSVLPLKIADLPREGSDRETTTTDIEATRRLLNMAVRHLENVDSTLATHTRSGSGSGPSRLLSPAFGGRPNMLPGDECSFSVTDCTSRMTECLQTAVS